MFLTILNNYTLIMTRNLLKGCACNDASSATNFSVDLQNFSKLQPATKIVSLTIRNIDTLFLTTNLFKIIFCSSVAVQLQPFQQIYRNFQNFHQQLEIVFLTVCKIYILTLTMNLLKKMFCSDVFLAVNFSVDLQNSQKLQAATTNCVTNYL